MDPQAAPGVEEAEDLADDGVGVVRVAPPVIAVERILAGGADDGFLIRARQLAPQSAHAARMLCRRDDNDGGFALITHLARNFLHFLLRIDNFVGQDAYGGRRNPVVDEDFAVVFSSPMKWMPMAVNARAELAGRVIQISGA
jgi:hypothetical protein